MTIALPGLSSSVSHALTKMAHGSQVHLNVIISCTEQTFRNGFSEFKDIEKLLDSRINVKQIEGLRIGFVISDQIGVFIFYQSLYFEDNSKGVNTVEMDAVTLNRILCTFLAEEDRKFHEYNHAIIVKQQEEFNNKSFEAYIQNEGVIANPINNRILEETKRNLMANPPLRPDKKKILDVYTTKFQYVELTSKNSKPTNHRAQLPENSIPINDPMLRKSMSASIKAYDETSDIVFTQLENLNKKVDQCRKTFLYRLKCRNSKSIIKKEDKINFLEKIELFNQDYVSLKEKIIKSLDAQKEKTLQSLRKEWPRLIELDNKNKAEFYSLSKTEKKEFIEAKLDNMLGKIKFPNAKQMMDDLGLKVFWSELTWDDLNDKEFQKEFLELRLITEGEKNNLASFDKAIGTIS